jgi:hypothetical protein
MGVSLKVDWVDNFRGLAGATPTLTLPKIN